MAADFWRGVEQTDMGGGLRELVGLCGRNGNPVPWGKVVVGVGTRETDSPTIQGK